MSWTRSAASARSRGSRSPNAPTQPDHRLGDHRALLDDGLIVPRQVARRARPAARPAARHARAQPGAAFVSGVKLAPDQITVAATNFRADVLDSVSLPIRIDRQPASVIADLVEDGVRRCIEDAGSPSRSISGLCVGLPGIVERASGICRHSPIFRERDVPFGADLGPRLGIAVTVDSDVNLVTLAEHWFGHGRGLDDFLVVSIEHNLGLGIMHDGELFRGANGLSPDLGDLLVRPASPLGTAPPRAASPRSPRRPRSWPPPRTRARNAARAAPARDARHRARGQARAAGDTRFAKDFRRCGRRSAIAIANLITLFAPPKVILAGSALAGRRSAARAAPRGGRERHAASLADVAEIVVHDWGDDIWARGAAAMTLRDLYGAPWNTDGPGATAR